MRTVYVPVGNEVNDNFDKWMIATNTSMVIELIKNINDGKLYLEYTMTEETYYKIRKYLMEHPEERAVQ